jgi:hypothetical protein
MKAARVLACGANGSLCHGMHVHELHLRRVGG